MNLDNNIKNWTILITFLSVVITSGYSLTVYAKDVITDHIELKLSENYVTTDAIETMRKDMNNLYVRGQLDVLQEKIFEIQDKEIDNTVTNVERKKLIRLKEQKHLLGLRIINL